MRHRTHRMPCHGVRCGDTHYADVLDRLEAIHRFLPEQVWCDHGVDLLVDDCAACDEEDSALAVSVPYTGAA